jgi:hypothetical protein
MVSNIWRSFDNATMSFPTVHFARAAVSVVLVLYKMLRGRQPDSCDLVDIVMGK